MSSIPRSFLHSLPAAPHIDVSTIKGNISDEEKQLGANIFSYFVNSREESYGAEVGKRLRLDRPSLRSMVNGPGIPILISISFLLDMCNVFGTLHGACAAYIVDPCSVSSLVVLGAAIGADGTGVSQSLNVIWHQPAKMGTKLRVVSTSVFIHGRIRTARCELWDKERDKLYVSAIHTTVNNTRPSLAKL
ncbi:hypothetical protein EDD18DRAFT_1069622 [Armillaria luteobubalina]|uniref:Thioesterase domain-containing protein n=1 Tax=Armillaria luteobubalina TaxID=153913 RepID=A0AA39QCD6_9AGAR|nr:hypothetical protein EDD18DRAFT_1069622 [Armillaria luteobubalina]